MEPGRLLRRWLKLGHGAGKGAAGGGGASPAAAQVPQAWPWGGEKCGREEALKEEKGTSHVELQNLHPRWTPAPALKHHRFLTHAHCVHLAGITTTSAAGAVYASCLTVLSARHIFPQVTTSTNLHFVSLSCLLLLIWSAFPEFSPSQSLDPMHSWRLSSARRCSSDPDGDFTVTAFNANHCPGTVMFLLEGAIGNVLHTGDCQLTPDCIQGLPLRYITVEIPGATQATLSCRIDYLFLDCTFSKRSLQFPAKEALHSAGQPYESSSELMM
ncbi:hypothetical protein ACQ4PT_045368 [Festuca glaucescens]